MGRDFEYYGDYDPLDAGRWEHNYKRAIAGKPGQANLRRLRAALLAMPRRRLIATSLCLVDVVIDPANDFGDLITVHDVCAVGQFVLDSGLWTPGELMKYEDDYEYWGGAEATVNVGHLAGLTKTLAWAIGEQNDLFPTETPEQRWERIYQWVDGLIR